MDSIWMRIGERDGWICGICQDPQRPVRKPPDAVTLTLPLEMIVVEQVPADEVIDGPFEDAEDVVARKRRHPLAPVIDHIVPRSRGGSNDPSNLQIAHWRCNALKHDGPAPVPAYAAAVLTYALDGTPMPLSVWQQQHGECLPPVFKLQRGEVAMEGWQQHPQYRDWLARHGHRYQESLARRAERDRRVRTWAAEQGYDLPSDRIPASVQRAYRQAHPGPIRAWAAEQGYELAGRRIPASVIKAYREAHLDRAPASPRPLLRQVLADLKALEAKLKHEQASQNGQSLTAALHSGVLG